MHIALRNRPATTAHKPHCNPVADPRLESEPPPFVRRRVPRIPLQWPGASRRGADATFDLFFGLIFALVFSSSLKFFFLSFFFFSLSVISFFLTITYSLHPLDIDFIYCNWRISSALLYIYIFLLSLIFNFFYTRSSDALVFDTCVHVIHLQRCVIYLIKYTAI